MTSDTAQKSLYKAVFAQEWTKAKELITTYGLDPDADNGKIWNHARSDSDYKILLGELGCRIHTAGAQKHAAASSHSERILYFVEQGLDLNSRPPGQPTVSYFTHYIVNKNISTDLVQALIEKGANPAIDNQEALKDSIARAKFPFIKTLLDAGCRLDANDGTFFYSAVFALLAQAEKSVGSREQMMRVLDFLLEQGASPALDGGWMMQRLQENQMHNPHAIDVYNYLQDHIERQIANTAHRIDPLFFKDKDIRALRSEFNVNGVRGTGFLHAAMARRFDEALECLDPANGAIEPEDMLDKDKRGIRVIDYLCAKGQLELAFNTSLWDKREGRAIDLEEKLRPRHRNPGLTAPLKLARVGRSLNRHRPLRRRHNIA